MATIQDLQRLYAPDFEIFNEDEEDRIEKIKMYGFVLDIGWESC
jgi:hypothetical protein